MLRALLNRRTFTAGALATALSSAGSQQVARAQDATLTVAPEVLSESRPIALGVMAEFVEDMATLDELADQIGRDPAIVMYHVHWGNTSGEFNLPLLEFLDERGIVPLVTWESWRPIYAGGVAVAEQPEFSLRSILDEEHDEYLERWVSGAASFGKPILLRFGHEMNGNWYPWAVGVNGNTAQDFVDAWRYVHDKFADAGADNVQFVWTPNASSFSPVEGVFPGDDYVEYVGMSGFNWGTTAQTWGTGTWQTFSEIFMPMYETLQRLTEKPIIIAEMASAEEGGSKAEWITSGLLTELPESFPGIRAVVWFNIIKEIDWRIDSSPESLRAFVQAANSPYLQGTLELTD